MINQKSNTDGPDPSSTGQRRSAGSPRGGDVVYLLFLPVLMISAGACVGLWIPLVSGTLVRNWTTQMLWAGGITAIGAFAGSVLMAVVWLRWATYLPQGVLGAMAARLTITSAGVVVASASMPELGQVFYLGTTAFYIIGLISETILAIKIIRSGYDDPGQAGDGERSVD